MRRVPTLDAHPIPVQSDSSEIRGVEHNGGIFLCPKDVTPEMVKFATLLAADTGIGQRRSFTIIRKLLTWYLVPRALALGWYPNLQIGKQWTDRPLLAPPPPLQLEPSVVLAPAQQEAVDVTCAALRANRCHGGLLTAPCGVGKTLFAHAIAIQLGVPLVVCVCDSQQKNNFVAKSRQYCGASARVGVLQGKKSAPSPQDNVVVCMMQTVVKGICSGGDVSLVLPRDALVVYDEAHQFCSETRVQAMMEHVPCKYRLAMTATPTRSDELEPALRYCVGPHVYAAELSQQHLKARVLAYRSKTMTEWPAREGDGHLNEPAAVTLAFADPDFFEVVIKIIHRLLDEGHKVLVSCRRREFLERLHERLGRDLSGLLLGGGSREQHELAKSSRVCLGSETIVRQAMDGDFTALLPISSVKFLPAFQQLFGRLTRNVGGGSTSAPAAAAAQERPVPLVFLLYFACGPWIGHHNARLAFCHSKNFQIHMANETDFSEGALCPAPVPKRKAKSKCSSSSSSSSSKPAQREVHVQVIGSRAPPTVIRLKLPPPPRVV